MAWVRIDDNFFSHPKVLQAWWAYPTAIGLWPMTASYAGRQQTDGVVSADYVHSLLPARRQRERATEALVDAGLWLPNGAGWQFHDWTEYNPTRAQTDERKRVDRERKRTAIR